MQSKPRNLIQFLLLSIFLFSLPSCKRDVFIHTNEVTKIQGKITSLPSTQLTVKGIGTQNFYANETGDFYIKPYISRPGVYSLQIDESSLLFFARPGDSISLVSDYRNLQNGAIFKGSNSLENTFLSEFVSLKGEIFEDDFLAHFAMPYDSFSKIADHRDEFLTNAAQEFQKKNGTFTESFNSLIMKDIAFENAKFRLSYPINKKAIYQDSISLPETYESFLQNLDIDNSDNFLVPSFEEFVLLWLDYLSLMKNPNGVPTLQIKWEKIDENIQDDRLRNFLFHNTFMEAVETDFETFQKFSTIYDTYQNDTSFLRVEKMYVDALGHLMEGKVAPEIIAKSMTSKDINLSTLRGKYKYIDVWATWCAPCVKEIPALQELQKMYKDAPIEFVSISIDDNMSVWKGFVRNKKLTGLQLFVEGAWEADIIRKFHIESIPRFILLDKENNIINANAPRPSEPRLKQILESYIGTGTSMK